MKKLANISVLGMVVILVLTLSLWAEEPEKIPGETDLIDIPTAKILEKNHYQIEFRFYQEGGLLVRATTGLTENFTIGASYGGKGVIGQETPVGNPQPAFSLKYKLGEQGKDLPFFWVVGYDGQGYGKYYREGETISGGNTI